MTYTNVHWKKGRNKTIKTVISATLHVLEQVIKMSLYKMSLHSQTELKICLFYFSFSEYAFRSQQYRLCFLMDKLFIWQACILNQNIHLRWCLFWKYLVSTFIINYPLQNISGLYFKQCLLKDKGLLHNLTDSVDWRNNILVSYFINMLIPGRRICCGNIDFFVWQITECLGYVSMSKPAIFHLKFNAV